MAEMPLPCAEELAKDIEIFQTIEALRIELRTKGCLNKNKHALLNKHTSYVEARYKVNLIYDEDLIEIEDSQPAIRQMKNIRPFIRSVKEGYKEGRLFHFMLKIFRFTISDDSAKRYYYQEDWDE